MEILNKRRLLTPGPTPLPETVRLALAQDMLHHRKPQFRQIMASAQEKLRILFGADSPVLPLSCSGTGAMTAAVYSLFKPGEKALVIEAGKFGERWVEIARARGLETIVLKVEWGKAASPEAVEKALAENAGVAGVLAQMCETSTGVMMPIQDIAKVAQKHNALLIVDGISGVGISPCPMDAWGLDCLLTGSQKGLMLPPGLAFLALSQKAWKRAENIAPGCYYFNLPAERKNLLKNETHFTPPVNLLVGLNASLDFILQDGIDAIYKKQWALAMLVRSGAKALNLELLAKDNFSWGVTAIKMPQGVNAGDILAIAQKDFGVIMAGGQDALKGKIIRIGHMGWVDWSDCLAGLQAMAFALKKNSHIQINAGYVDAAMEAYAAALDNWPRMDGAN